MSISPVSFLGVQNIAGVNEALATKQVSAAGTKLMNQQQKDSVSFSGRSDSMTDSEKQELLLKARTSAAGWSVFFLGLSTLYFAARSDRTVAKKYALDIVEDKALIKKIKKEQILHTVPALLGLGLVGYIYNKCFAEPEDVDL